MKKKKKIQTKNAFVAHKKINPLYKNLKSINNKKLRP